jgi:hypothetical protein
MVFCLSCFSHLPLFFSILQLLEISTPAKSSFKLALMNTLPLPPTTYINPIGWHHATETYHSPHSSLHTPPPRVKGGGGRFLTFEDGNDLLSRNVGKELPLLSA